MFSQFERLKISDLSSARMNEILTKIESVNALVMGDVGVDRYTQGIVERISPEAPVPIVCVTDERLKLGLAANVADNVRALGAEASLLGLIGEDRFAEDLIGLLDRSGISSEYLVRDKTRRTVLKERIVTETQQLLRVDYETTQKPAESVIAKALSELERGLSKANVLIVEDYQKGFLSSDLLSRAFALARKKGISIFVDPNLKGSLNLYVGATLMTPNRKEAEALVGFRLENDEAILNAGKVLLEKGQADSAVITLGKEGMALFEKSGKSYWIETAAREVFDVSGAGDTVIAVLALAMATGATLSESAILANIAAGIEVGKRGTATVSPDEIRNFVAAN